MSRRISVEACTASSRRLLPSSTTLYAIELVASSSESIASQRGRLVRPMTRLSAAEIALLVVIGLQVAQGDIQLLELRTLFTVPAWSRSNCNRSDGHWQCAIAVSVRAEKLLSKELSSSACSDGTGPVVCATIVPAVLGPISVVLDLTLSVGYLLLFLAPLRKLNAAAVSGQGHNAFDSIIRRTFNACVLNLCSTVCFLIFVTLTNTATAVIPFAVLIPPACSINSVVILSGIFYSTRKDSHANSSSSSASVRPAPTDPQHAQAWRATHERSIDLHPLQHAHSPERSTS